MNGAVEQNERAPLGEGSRASLSSPTAAASPTSPARPRTRMSGCRGGASPGRRGHLGGKEVSISINITSLVQLYISSSSIIDLNN
jgi:hypothetical protein